VATERPATTGDVALAGPDGRRIADLLRLGQEIGQNVLTSLMEPAARELVRLGPHALVKTSHFSERQLNVLTDALQAPIAAADMLGRYRVRERQQKAERAGGLHRMGFAETPFAGLSDVPKLPPEAAARYFNALIPSLGIDPAVYGQWLRRRAFTLALATEETLLSKVQKVIAQSLEEGRAYQDTPGDINDLLLEAGVSPRNPQYAEMVWRTNMMDSYNVGLETETQKPEVRDFFPVWQYFAIVDNRSRPHHAERNRNYYPNGVPFNAVRGTAIGEVANCRCTFRPVDRYEWRDLQSRGAKVTAGYL
jgi:hypothetical protein